MYYLGIDVGSMTTKAVLIDAQGTIVSQAVMKTGAAVSKAIATVETLVFDNVSCMPSDIVCTVATGYGRKNVARADKKVTEITAHARGTRHLFPETKMIIDIGGQDTKVIALSEDGNVDDFVMNDKCAAGTGRFLEVMAHLIDVPLSNFGEKALRHTNELSINSTCTVFAESEVISLIARQEKEEDIAYAIHSSVVERIISLTKKLHTHGDVTLTGGVSFNIAIQNIIKNRLKVSIHIPQNPQIVGALGAALIACHSCAKKYN